MHHIVAPGFVDRPRRSDCTAGQMDGEAGWWTTSGTIGLPPLARAMGVGRQQHHMEERWSCHSGHKLLCKLCRNVPPPAMGLIKVGDVETNPGPTNTHNQVWICDICHKQIHVRKQISISCNRIEHWVHVTILL